MKFRFAHDPRCPKDPGAKATRAGVLLDVAIAGSHKQKSASLAVRGVPKL